jgi:hypothetical protein
MSILAILAALVAAPSLAQRAPTWMEGRFEGVSPRDGHVIGLRIANPGGVTVTTRKGPTNLDRSYASYTDGILSIDKDRYTVQRTRDGFRAVPYYDRDSDRHDGNGPINFHRTGEATDIPTEPNNGRRDDTRNDRGLPDWMVGTFEGVRRDRKIITLRGTDRSELSAQNRDRGHSEVRGSASYRRGVLTLDGREYRVEQAKDGFRAVPIHAPAGPRDDSYSRIDFRRIDDRVDSKRSR